MKKSPKKTTEPVLLILPRLLVFVPAGSDATAFNYFLRLAILARDAWFGRDRARAEELEETTLGLARDLGYQVSRRDGSEIPPPWPGTARARRDQWRRPTSNED